MLLVPKEGNIETSYDHLRDSWVDFLLVRYHYLKNESTSYIYEGYEYIISCYYLLLITLLFSKLPLTIIGKWLSSNPVLTIKDESSAELS